MNVKFKVHTYEVIQSVKLLIFLVNTALCQEEDVEVVLGELFQRLLSVLQYLRGMSTLVGSTTASMNQPPAAGQAGPSAPPKGAQVPGMFTAEQVAQIAQIVAIATRQQSQPPPP